MKLKEYENIKLYHGDCMDLLKQTPDKYYDLCIVDPPYGINRFKNGETSRLRKYGQLNSANNLRPDVEYVTELFRISKNQIIWGFNHLCDLLPPSSGFVFWFKHQPVISYSDGELAWTSFADIARCFDYPYFGCHGADISRIHPTQKPIALYDWIIKNYVKQGDKILDTHLGSGSIVISVDKANRINNMNLQFTGIEIDVDYFNDMIKRFENYKSQLTLTLI